MKNKGFTLIELLAVIVILAIIAVIAIPNILKVVDESQKGAIKDSTYGYIDAIAYNNQMANLSSSYTKISGSDVSVSDINVNVKGKKPDNGYLTVNKKGEVVDAELCFGNYKSVYENGKATVTKESNCSSTLRPIISDCPGCVYAFSTVDWSYNMLDYYPGASRHPNTVLNSSLYKKNYQSVVSESGQDFFVGINLDEDTNTITKASVCGTLNAGTADAKLFCIPEISSQSVYDNVKNMLANPQTGVYGPYDENTHKGCIDGNHYMECYGSFDVEITYNSFGTIIVQHVVEPDEEHEYFRSYCDIVDRISNYTVKCNAYTITN